MQADLLYEGPNLPAHLLGTDPLNLFLTVGIQGVAFRAAYVAGPVKTVYSKASVLIKVRLSVQAVHMEATGTIINSKKRSMRESGFKSSPRFTQVQAVV